MATAAPRSAPRVVPPANAGAPAAPAAGKSRKLVIALVIAVLLAMAGAGAWFFMQQPAKPIAAPAPVFVVLEPFTVNLQGDTGEYLHLSITLQVADTAQADQLKLYLPQLRSRLLLLLSSQKSAELSTVEGKKKLSAEIAAQSSLPFTPQAAPPKVSNVFFTAFVIQ